MARAGKQTIVAVKNDFEYFVARQHRNDNVTTDSRGGRRADGDRASFFKACRLSRNRIGDEQIVTGGETATSHALAHADQANKADFHRIFP
jgi:hypothetical protein